MIAWLRDRSLGTKFALLLTGVLVITLSVVTAISIYTQQRLFLENLGAKGEALGNFVSLISPQTILAYDFESMTDFVREIGKEEDVVYAVLIAANGINLTSFLDDSKEIVRKATEVSKQDNNILEIVVRIDQRSDVVSLRFPIHFDGKEIGTVALGLSTTRIDASIRRTLGRTLLTSGAIIIFLVVVLYAGFRIIVMRRIEHLQQGVQRVAAGVFDSKIEVQSHDEIGSLTGSFNEMEEQLAATISEKDDALRQLSVQAEELKVLRDEAVRANRHKSEFLANMSHELRTPLNAIIGFSDVLRERMFGELNDKQGEYVEDIHSSGRHLLSLINDILDLSKIEAGHMELNRGAFDLPAAIENSLVLVRERASRHAIRIESHIDDRLGEYVGDERKLKQIMLNLLSNAIKFTPDEGQVSVWAIKDELAVRISVQDTGIGIAADDIKRVFDEFQQANSNPDVNYEGTGLGLALTRTFVEMHGGEINVESEPNKGSTFSFTLPLEA